MELDPEVVLAKRRSTIREWLGYAEADAMVDDWRAAEAEAAITRQLNGGR